MIQPSQLDLKQLRYFVAIVEAGSLTRAAASLNVAQPALSNRLRRMEDELGVGLLVRSTQGVVPTEEGELLYVAAKRLMRDLGDVAETVRSRGRRPTGHVGVGCTESIANILALPVIRTVFDQLPDVNLAFVAGQSIDLYRRLIAGDIDIAVISMTDRMQGISSAPLLTEEYFLVAPATDDPLPGRDSVTIAELSRLPIILPCAAIYSVQRMLGRLLGVDNLEFNIVARVDSVATITDLVVHRHGCSILGWSAVHQAALRGDVLLKRIEGCDLQREFELCRAVDRRSNCATDAVERIMNSTIGRLIANQSWRHAALA